MCEELDKCYGTDGSFVRQTYVNANGVRRLIPEYKSYDHAQQRCTNPNHVRYPRYGARGIQFKFKSFAEFWDEVGKKPTPKHSIDRIDNQGHYEVGNVRWATATEQANNKG